GAHRLRPPRGSQPHPLVRISKVHSEAGGTGGAGPRNRVAQAELIAMNVLVVDDDVAIRTLVTRLFARRGDKVQSAVDGDAAIECLKTHTFDLIVLDLMMPRTDGFGVLTYLSTLDGDRPK